MFSVCGLWSVDYNLLYPVYFRKKYTLLVIYFILFGPKKFLDTYLSRTWNFMFYIS